MLATPAAAVFTPATIFASRETWDGARALARLLDLAANYVEELRGRIAQGTVRDRAAFLGRVRGTGPGVSFSALVQTLWEAFPISLQSPFEESANVSGAVLEASRLVAPERDDALLRLRFSEGARDLPMHAHEDSDRFLYVVGGRGFFHVSFEPVSAFSGADVRTFAVRAGDLVLFSRGTVHTFSTEAEALDLLSYHAPYVALTDARQYVVPFLRHCPGLTNRTEQSEIVCDAAWNQVA